MFLAEYDEICLYGINVILGNKTIKDIVTT